MTRALRLIGALIAVLAASVGPGWAGVIGDDDRMAFDAFVPPPAFRPGWAAARRAVFEVECATSTGTAWLIEVPGRAGQHVAMSAHQLLGVDGSKPPDGACVLLGTGLARAPGLLTQRARVGRYRVATAGYAFDHRAVAADWAIVPLASLLMDRTPLRLSHMRRGMLTPGETILSLSGGQAGSPIDGMQAQVCRYLGRTPQGRSNPLEFLGAPVRQVGRFDCDIAGGASGGPILAPGPDGMLLVVGLMTDTTAVGGCDRPGYLSCFSAGPLAEAIAAGLKPR
ncbi:MAG: hypothetical protein ACU0BF_12140 [Paracoccaceae bacterium]